MKPDRPQPLNIARIVIITDCGYCPYSRHKAKTDQWFCTAIITSQDLKDGEYNVNITETWRKGEIPHDCPLDKVRIT